MEALTCTLQALTCPRGCPSMLPRGIAETNLPNKGTDGFSRMPSKYLLEDEPQGDGGCDQATESISLRDTDCLGSLTAFTPELNRAGGSGCADF